MTVDSTIQRIARLTPLDVILASLQSRVAAVMPRRTPLSQGLGAQVLGAVLAAVQAFIEVLRDEAVRDRIRALGMEPAAQESI